MKILSIETSCDETAIAIVEAKKPARPHGSSASLPYGSRQGAGGDKEGNAVSKEFCGGPHAETTGDLAVGRGSDGSIRKDMIFKIQKEEASSAGVRRIKAILE